VVFDTSQLTPTSSKQGLRWRDTALTLVWVRAEGPIEVAHKLADKRTMVEACGPEDRLLAVRYVQFPPRQEVMVVDDRERAREALAA
jgi:hypothetical protein